MATPFVQTAVASLPKRRRFPAAIRVNQILDAALDVFSSQGFGTARVEDIARSTGLSKGAVYLHFKSKEEILEALLEKELRAWPALLPNDHQDSQHDALSTLSRTLLNPIFSRLAEPRSMKLIRLVFGKGAQMPECAIRARELLLDGRLAAIQSNFRSALSSSGLLDDDQRDQTAQLMTSGIALALWQIVFDEATTETIESIRSSHCAAIQARLFEFERRRVK